MNKYLLLFWSVFTLHAVEPELDPMFWHMIKDIKAHKKEKSAPRPCPFMAQLKNMLVAQITWKQFKANSFETIIKKWNIAEGFKFDDRGKS